MKSKAIERLAAILRERGLAEERYGLSGRKIRGRIGTRRLRGDLGIRRRSGSRFGMRQRLYAGHRSSLEIESATAGRLIVAPANQGVARLVARLNALSGLQRIDGLATLTGLELWASDGEWALRLFADPRVQAACRELLPRELPSVGLQLRIESGRDVASAEPSFWWWHSTRAPIDQIVDRFPGWLDALERLSDATDTLPGPAKVYVPTWIERNSRIVAAVGCLGFGLAIVVLPLLLVLLAVLLSRS